ncbi:UbiX family flavin prenyltransferase [Desulfovibrio gilichinskyi]|uniref:Flavin prenyltransferase UbiX n=1 Tax=Desulfovibrio gilichinskyi TaxID=1519643 RepID=A0A1X7CB79_9BACT|nr:UbiX family flavin prenyltransferase [Desulfovibrio gilichinskyi]SME93405.1 4-hydroxy-3-polyprenylbenzoate decarboxylase [Desulfovibrio gilichinskyi]
MDKKRIILAATGASGTIYTLSLAKELGKRNEIELHLIISDAALKVMELETDFKPEDLTVHADFVYQQNLISAPPASGSWQHDGMIICPCSMSSLAAIANGMGSNLIHRAADVSLKERRKLILITRETPLNLIHIRNMETVTLAGGTVMPASPGFYHSPRTINDIAEHMTGRILEQLSIPHDLYKRWGENSRR